MYGYADIRSVHLELTERCNAACPQCPRRIDGGKLNEKLTMAELSLADIQSLMPVEFVAQLKKIYLCGNYGDPAAATDTLKIIVYFRNISETLRLGLHTNGSLKDESWWAAIAQTTGTNGYVRFAIDGLEDTNHIYRRNTDWHKIMANAQAFIQAGGKAEWDFLVFAHNEHQVETARERSAEMGFTAFNVKKTNRFLERNTMAYAASSPVRDRSGNAVTVLERPQESRYQNETLNALGDQSASYASFDRYLDAREIRCKVQTEKSIYISAEGKVLPCCWLGQMLKNPAGSETRDAEARFPEIFRGVVLDGKARTIEAIVKDKFFTEDIPDGWSGAQKTKVCARVCGQ